MKRLWLLVAGWLLAGALAAAPAPRIAAASSLQTVLPELADAYRYANGATLRITYGSSGNFSRQIVQGAPFEMFLSADEAYVDRLAALGLTLDRGQVYALGRIALVAPARGELDPAAGLPGLRAALAAGRVKRFAIANPEHAPYGRAAREALQRAGVWDAIQPYLVRGENASQAARFALGGSSQGGIVPYALALSPALARLGEAAPIAPDQHRPIRQRMVLLRGAGEVARGFYTYLAGPEAAALLRRHGYETPLR